QTIDDKLNYLQINDAFGGYNFSSSLSGQLVLNLAGSCPFLEPLTELRQSGIPVSIDDLNLSLRRNNASKQLNAYLVANLTYFYPVYYKTGFTVQVDAEAIS